MSKTAVDPNALMMQNAEKRRAKKEAEIDARVEAAAGRLGPRKKKNIIEPATVDETTNAKEAPVPQQATTDVKAEAVEQVKKASRKSRRAGKQTTVEIDLEVYREVDRILYERKMRGERTTFKDFLNGALRMAIDSERGNRG